MGVIKKGKSKSADIRAEIRGLGVMIEKVDHHVGVIAEQYSGISKKLDSHTEMIGGLATDMTIVKQDIEFIKQGLRRKIDVEEFSALERRVALLEKRAPNR